MTFRLDDRFARPDKAAGVLGLTLWAAACAAPSPPPPVATANDDTHQCIKTALVDLVRLDPGQAPKIDPGLLRRYYPDRAARMMEQGSAIYDCRLDAVGTVCTAAQVDPAGVGFEHVPLARLVTPAPGETMRLRLTFKILETERCRVQYASA
ncbi:hypothetical protein [Caulobacter sp. UNC279MFTsu5.1]|uniref:hypothetical protein n=1 Tax=Caulobacter sp. UNC279MFTsu5.1 TaxID=1502775 RepID=UPI0003747C0C|nr:hypothetical protein [Caulobacter sp. UNC279MFTsu5.1]SFK08944.1 hypothetical protein SAMN02799626_03367 [Caulobacter sp. UNC279MFTsu5.1]